jgi:hypothetical protein
VAIGIVPLVLEQRRSADSVIAETIRIKGLRPSLRFYRELDGSAEVLENGSEVHERDLPRSATSQAARNTESSSR